jgi:hypothetical protein
MKCNVLAFSASPKATRPAQPSIAAGPAKIIRLDPTPFGQRLAASIDAQRAAIVSERTRVSDDDWYRAFGARLRAARLERGVSEEEAARAAGRRVATWRKYEATGKGRLTFPLREFANRFGVSFDYLLEGLPD